MSRPLRINYPGAWYHVMNRGACREPIFYKDKHFELFQELLHDINVKFDVEIHAYCLMSNHYHLLIRTPFANLSNSMQHLSSVYTKRYNKSKKDADGPLFRGRFKSKLVEADSYLLQLGRYIHLNPYEARMVKEGEQYKWSSFPVYLNLADAPPWLFTDEILQHYDPNNFAEDIYDFTMQGNSNELKKMLSSSSSPVIGSKKFLKSIQGTELVDGLSSEVTGLKYIRPSLEDIISTISTVVE